MPVFTLAIALLFGFEHFNKSNTLSWVKVGSIGVTVAGATYIAVGAFMASKPTVDNGTYKNPLVGNILLLTNKLCVSSYPILEKKMLKKYSPMVIVAWAYACGAGLTLMSVIPCAINPSAWHLSSSGIQAIFFSGILSSAFNYSLMCWVNKHSSPVFVMACYPLQSVMTPLFAWLLLGAAVSGSDVGGGVIICIGLAMLLIARWREQKGHGPSTASSHHQQLVDDKPVAPDTGTLTNQTAPSEASGWVPATFSTDDASRRPAAGTASELGHYDAGSTGFELTPYEYRAVVPLKPTGVVVNGSGSTVTSVPA